MRILIAGGGGFIGVHLCRRFLAAGHELVVLDNFVTGRLEAVRSLQDQQDPRRITLVLQDACRRAPDVGPLDAVMHLASPASPVDYVRLPLETLESGSTATHRLLELARRQRARFLLASTSEVYGDPEVHPQVESYRGHVDPVGPRSVYDEAKRYAEAYATAFGKRHGIQVRIARIFNTYGPGMRLDDGRVIPTFVANALRDRPLRVFRDGSQTRSFCYVDDLVRGLEALLWSDLNGPVNLGNPEELTILETAERIRTLLGAKSPIVFEHGMDDDPRRRRPDITRARTHLGWSPTVTLEEGLVSTVEDLAARLRVESDPRPSLHWHAPISRRRVGPHRCDVPAAVDFRRET